MSRQIREEVCPFKQRFAEETAEPGYATRGSAIRRAGYAAWALDEVK